MFEIRKGNIYITRGDTARFTAGMEEKVGTESVKRPLVTGDTVKFLIKKSSLDDDKDALLTKVYTTFVDGEAKIHLAPADTAGLKAGTRYYYAVKFFLANEDIYTVVEKAFVTTGGPYD